MPIQDSQVVRKCPSLLVKNGTTVLDRIEEARLFGYAIVILPPENDVPYPTSGYQGSDVTTVKSVPAVLVVAGVAAGWVTTIVVPGPTTLAALRRNSSGIRMTSRSCAVETMLSCRHRKRGASEACVCR